MLTRLIRRAALGALAFGLLASSPAAAAVEDITVRYGPIQLDAYQVKRGDAVFNIPKPAVDGYITRMSARLVYADGREVPIANTMLHHVVMADLGRFIGEHRDPTCNRFRMFDSQSFLPLHGHRFYGLGEERHRIDLPPGYGYATKAADRWAMTYMLMNHLPRGETVFVEYTTGIERTATLKPIVPIWLDVKDCNLDPVYDVPGGRRRGSTHTRSVHWTAPSAGRIVFSVGHQHGGGKGVRLVRPDCNDQALFTSKPLWGLPSHPYYSVKPLLHEPGPISMTSLQSAKGIPVAKGERLRLDSLYDNQRYHVRTMGIMIVGFSPDDAPTPKCAPLPDDIRTYWTEPGGRTKDPAVTVPITGAPKQPGRRAVAISRPPGATVALRNGSTVDVARFAFSPANVAVRRGSLLRWRFFDQELHNVTLANGPRGFSSDNLDGGRSYAYRFSAPGTYRIFCTLHPVGMNQTVRVGP